MYKYLLLSFDWYSTNPAETSPRKTAINQNVEAMIMSSPLMTFQTFVFDDCEFSNWFTCKKIQQNFRYIGNQNEVKT